MVPFREKMHSKSGSLHSESGLHLLEAAYKDMEAGRFAFPLLAFIDNSSIVLLRHPFTAMRTYFCRIPAQAEEQPREQASLTNMYWMLSLSVGRQ